MPESPFILRLCDFIRFQAAEQELISHLNGIYFIDVAVNQFRVCGIFEIFVSQVKAVHRLHQVIQQALVICIRLRFLFKKSEQRVTSLSVIEFQRAETL